MFQQSALAGIKQMSKMKTYSILKDNFSPEGYLTSVQNISDRTTLKRLRLSNHYLMIEKGRHQNIIRVTDRTCPFCPNKVENEFHFLLECPTYKNLREDLLKNIKASLVGFFYPTDEQFLFWLMLCCPVISQYTARFIKLAMELRAFLLETSRNPI